MNTIDNNQFEVKPGAKSKRKITTPCPNVYLNPALDLLANEDPICNTAMEVAPVKKRKRTRSCDIAAFENTGLDIGASRAAINEFLARELENVRKNVRNYVNPIDEQCSSYTNKENLSPERHDIQDVTFTSPINDNMQHFQEPIYHNLTDLTTTVPNITELSSTEPKRPINMAVSEFHNISDVEMDSGISVLEQKSVHTLTMSHDVSKDSSMHSSGMEQRVTSKVIINNTSNTSLSFIDRLALDSPSLSNQSLYFDDDLNESNIMEIKTITIITKKKRIVDHKKNTNPFLDPNLNENTVDPAQNPFLLEDSKPELEYHEEVANPPIGSYTTQAINLMPRRLFASDTNSTISTVNESISTDNHEYENIDGYRSESPIYENINGQEEAGFNKQSKVLGCDVSRFSAVDIMNLNRKSEANSSNNSNDSRKDLKHQFLKAGNKLSKKVLKTLKKTFKHDKVEHNATLNPYEVPRKPPKQKTVKKEAGIENPALNLDNSDEIEIEELNGDDHLYETIKTNRNTQLNMNITPLKEKMIDNFDSSQSKPQTPGKKVRFDSTLNKEKVITGNSFDCDIQSPGFDVKIDKYHDELENCINERKFIQQNM